MINNEKIHNILLNTLNYSKYFNKNKKKKIVILRENKEKQICSLSIFLSLSLSLSPYFFFELFVNIHHYGKTALYV